MLMEDKTPEVKREMDKRTRWVYDWIKSQPDDRKMLYAMNWRIPHSVFNITCRFIDPANLQGIDWYAIHQTKDIGSFSNGNKVVIW